MYNIIMCEQLTNITLNIEAMENKLGKLKKILEVDSNKIFEINNKLEMLNINSKLTIKRNSSISNYYLKCLWMELMAFHISCIQISLITKRYHLHSTSSPLRQGWQFTLWNFSIWSYIRKLPNSVQRWETTYREIKY